MLNQAGRGPRGEKTAIEAHNHAMSLPIAEVVAELVALVGATAVAAIGGVSETRAVEHWASGRREPQRAHALRFALQLATMLSGTSDGAVARAWFQGANPHVADAIPVILLRTKPLQQVQGPLLAAARAFAAR